MKNLRKYSVGLMSFNITAVLIKFYQAFFSPDHGIFSSVFGFSRCRFYPSCSEYTSRAIRQYGLFRGGMVSLKRIVRCGPWNEGGYEPTK